VRLKSTNLDIHSIDLPPILLHPIHRFNPHSRAAATASARRIHMQILIARSLLSRTSRLHWGSAINEPVGSVLK
jgi:hypothetical protein